MSLGRVVRGNLWLYVSSVATNFLGYVYWMVAAKFVEASTIGSAAAVVGASSLVAGVFSFGLSSGMTRIIGASAGRNDVRGISAYFFASLCFRSFKPRVPVEGGLQLHPSHVESLGELV